MFLFYWEMYDLIELIINLRNEDLHWFSGKRTFVDAFSGYVGSRVTSSVFM